MIFFARVSVLIIAGLNTLYSQSDNHIEFFGTVSDERSAVFVEQRVEFRNDKGELFATTTTSNGDYALRVPFGTYSASVRRSGFCQEKKADLQPNGQQRVLINFQLATCALEHSLTSVDNSRPDEMASRYRMPFLIERLRIANEQRLVGIRYGTKNSDGNADSYSGYRSAQNICMPVELVYGYFRITANKIVVTSKFSIIATGKVVLEDGSVSKELDRLEFEITGGNLRIKSVVEN